MGVRREFRLSSQLPHGGARSHRVLELLRWCECDEYLCARGSFGYMRDDGVFPIEGIEVCFQDFHSMPYPQISGKGTFHADLSVFDALFNIGPEETLKLIAAGTPRWRTWEEMLAMEATNEAREESLTHDLS
jgi:hypothetical protein